MEDVMNKDNLADVYLKPLEQTDQEQFTKDNQETFNFGAMEEFGMRDDRFQDGMFKFEKRIM
jgi:hypothetical protein